MTAATDLLRDRVRVAVRALKLSGVKVDPEIVARAVGGDIHRRPQHVRALIENAARDPFPWR